MSNKSCAYMGEPLPDGSRVCIPEENPCYCMSCHDGSWDDEEVTSEITSQGSSTKWVGHKLD
ncbi:MAG: hypothetical protein ACLGPL_06725 [Acidobacteriota bacterium]